MFAELVFASFACFGLYVIDSYNSSVGALICGLTVYFYAYCRMRIVDQKLIDVFLVAKIFSVIVCVVLKVYRIFRSCFTARKFARSGTKSQQHCGDISSLENEVSTFVANISKHHIHTWYDKISDNQEFVADLDALIKDTLISLCTSISKVDKKQFSFIASQIYFHYFTHFLDALKNKTIDRKNFKMKHWAMKDARSEWCYLQSLTSTLLDSFGPVENHNSIHSKAVSLIVVEILTENLIYPLLNLLANPARLNTWLLKTLKSSLHAQGDAPESSFDHTSRHSDVIKEDFYTSIPLVVVTTDTESINVSDEKETEMYDSVHSLVNNISDEEDNTEIKESLQICLKEDGPIYFTTGRKSTSNISLLKNASFTTVEASSDSAAVCNISMIKRSKSADFIQQMPRLKPLNDRNYSIVMHGKDNKMLVTLKSDPSKNGVEEAEEAVEVEVPTLFSGINITGTQQQVDSGHIPYTLYCIQYIGVFHDAGQCSETPEFVKLEVSIKRRFREFLALQCRLEKNPELRNSLKGIKGPSKWLASPFSNLDKKNISERKSFLESYLQELCNQDVIVHSSELQEFLAYGGDASIAFVKKASDITVPRIDKFLVRGVKGAIDLFRTALPNIPNESEYSKEVSSAIPKVLCKESNLDRRFQEYLLDFSSREPELKEHIINYFKYFDENSSTESIYELVEEMPNPPKRPSLLRNAFNLEAETSCKCPGTWDFKDKKYDLEENPFGNIVVDLFAETLQMKLLKSESFTSVYKLLCSSYINRYLENKLDCISQDLFPPCLHMLHKALWPEDFGNYDKSDVGDVNSILECLEEIFTNNNITNSILKKTLREKIHVVLLSFQHEQLNRCLLFHIFDVVIETLCSKGK